MPDVPSAKELGIPAYELQPFSALYVAASTPPALANELRAIVAKTMKTPAMLSMIEKRALLPMEICGDALRDYQVAEMNRMRRVVEQAGIQPE